MLGMSMSNRDGSMKMNSNAGVTSSNMGSAMTSSSITIKQEEEPWFNRQITKGAEAFKLIIEKSLAQNKNGIVSDYALSKAKNRFGTFAAEGFTLSNPSNDNSLEAS
jgi:hypothetical protein